MITTNRSIKNPKSTKCYQLSREHLLSYAAGLIDGEGCIGIYHNSCNGNYQLRISVEMVKREGLEVLFTLFKGKWYYKKAVSPRQARYIWMIFNSQAAKALKELLPYLKIKRKNAIVVLGADWFSFIKRKITEEQQEIRYKIWLKNKELNKRGFYKH